MGNGTVQVTAEWALWGKEPHDAEYRLLRCSDGTVGPDNFEEIITRYSPGTLDDLPQAAVAWLGNERQNYLAMTIHRAPEQRLYDASGRKVVLTYCFCVPFHELAAGTVSYRAMYEGFRSEQLPAADRAGIKVELPIMDPRVHGRGMAMHVAELLLTEKPVCILGADEISLDERLGFFDSVMTLLPYGMRGRLSAATWTSSIFDEHKFRLFFSSAPRWGDDHVLTWDPGCRIAIRNDVSSYAGWLNTNMQANVSLLATLTEPTGFRQPEIAQLMDRLQDLQRQAAAGYDADTPYSSSYTVGTKWPARKRSRKALPATKPMPAAAPAGGAPLTGERRHKLWRRKQARDTGAPAAQKRELKKAAASPPEAKYKKVRNAAAAATTEPRWDRWAITFTSHAIVATVAFIVAVAAILLVLALR